MYELKWMWATAYLRDNFFAGIRTTSICEGINSFIKRYVQSKNSLVDFLHNFDKVVNEYRHNELTSYFKSTYTQPVMTTALEKYELEASNLYTRNKFFDVRKEIEKVAAINVIDRSDVGNVVRMKMNKFGSPDVENVVQLDKSNGDTSKKDLLRSGAVGAACNRLNKAARKNPHNFIKNIKSIHKLAKQMEKEEGIDLNNSVDISRVVRDPTVVKTKGAPRKNKKKSKKRRCSYCKRPGHTGQSKKKRKRNGGVKHNEAVKLTQESVNELRSSDVNTTHESGMRSKFNTKSDFNVNQMSTPSLFDNHVYVSNMILQVCQDLYILDHQ
ncbi:protein FAR1-RELATED SEQUENCE 5-like [Sesbania bispinosa]|nr:protein FAR1-RELATED SEQUENCE 5-like [Sesbania bispinosa]